MSLSAGHPRDLGDPHHEASEVDALGLERGRHYHEDWVRTPVIDPQLYTTLGKTLFDLYQKYQVSHDDQRQMERLSYVLISFTRVRRQGPTSFWRRLFCR